MIPCRTAITEPAADIALASHTARTLGAGGYRLPTEAEWEYLCRAGTQSIYSFGNSLNGYEENVDGNYPLGTSTKGKYLKRPTTVGSYSPNAFGLYDVHGNVSEWCFDVFDESVYGSRSGLAVDPVSESGSEDRVVRGGSWLGPSWFARSARRVRNEPVTRNRYLGVRLVR